MGVGTTTCTGALVGDLPVGGLPVGGLSTGGFLGESPKVGEGA
jgi:hypothetical protein